MLSSILDRIYNACSYILYGEQSLSSMMCHEISFDQFEDILKKNINKLNEKDEFGMTPFMYAIINQQPFKIIKMLLDYGADPLGMIEVNDERFNILHVAVTNLINKNKLSKKEYIEIIRLIYTTNEVLMNQGDEHHPSPATMLVMAGSEYIYDIFDGIIHVRRSQHF